jgi:hypothetical protein
MHIYHGFVPLRDWWERNERYMGEITKQNEIQALNGPKIAVCPELRPKR